MAEPTLKQKTAKGLFWGGLSSGIQQLLNLVFGLVLARILNAEDYGMVGMLAIFSAIAGTIQESGFTAALTNQKEIRKEDYNAVFWFSALTGITFYIMLFFCAPLIARFYERPELIGLSRVVFLGFLLGGLGIASNAYLFKQLMAKERAKIDIIALLCSGIVGITLALNDFAYYGLAAQTTVYIGVGSLLKLYFSPWKPSLQINFQPLRKMFGFGSKLLLTNLFTQVNNNVMSVVLGKFYNAQLLGYYSQGQNWMVKGQLIISGMLMNVIQPVSVEVKNDFNSRIMVFRKLIRFTSFIVFPLMLGLAFVAKELIIVLIGEKWLPSVSVLQILCIVGITYNLSLVCIQTLISHGYSGLIFKTNMFFYIVQILGIIFVCRFGFEIMLLFYVILNVIGMIIWMYKICHIFNFSILNLVRDIVPYLCISILVFVIVYYIVFFLTDNIYISLVTKIILSVCIYVLFMHVTNSKMFNDCRFFLWKKI